MSLKLLIASKLCMNNILQPILVALLVVIAMFYMAKLY